MSDLDSVRYVDEGGQWPALTTLVMVEGERRVGGKTAVESRYYISSLPNDASVLLNAVRSHWSIENQLHWSLDVTFNEDRVRVRNGNGAENFSVLRRMALNLLKAEKSTGAASPASEKMPHGTMTTYSRSLLNKMRLPWLIWTRVPVEGIVGPLNFVLPRLQDAQWFLFSVLVALCVCSEGFNDGNVLTSTSSTATINELGVAITGRFCWRSTCTTFAWTAYLHCQLVTSAQPMQVGNFNVTWRAGPSVGLGETFSHNTKPPDCLTLKMSRSLQLGTCAVMSALKSFPWLGTRRWSNSWAITKSWNSAS